MDLTLRILNAILLLSFGIELLKETLIRFNILFHFVSIDLPIEMIWRKVRVNQIKLLC